ncbi:hypothetical protein MMC28_008380 [Mycoblastus sanguinarius]|nr:hypothetical protein [Mycoblastus sanguinarius]
MHRSLFSVLSALAIALPISASLSSAVEQRSPSTQATRLRPISIRNYEEAMGIQRRDNSEDFSDLDLQTQSELIYGTPGDNGQLLLANMTLYAPDGLLMVLMERFDGLTSAVDCNGDDGQMSLTFNSEDAFNYALQQWNFINNSDNGTFLLIANNAGCGPDDQRQPYLITKVTEDTTSFTTYLTAQTAPWTDIAGTYDLDFGQAIPYQQPGQNQKRCLVDALCGDFSDSKSVTFNVDAGTPNQTTNIYTDSAGQMKLDCINCFVSGAFDVTGHFSTKDWSLQELSLTAAPQNFLAALELEATITASETPASLQKTVTLFSAPIPGAGISIDGIFTLGATLEYDVGVTSSFQGSGTIDFGLQVGLPNSALLTADGVNPDSSSAVGFNGGDVTPLFDVKDLSASVTLGAFSQPKLAFGISLVKVGDLDFAITVKLPEVTVTLTADYEQDGVCSQTPGSSTTGIKLTSELDIEVDLDIDATLGSDVKPSWSKELFNWSTPLPSACFPINIPGLAPVHTSVPTLPSTTAPLPSKPATIVYSASGATLAPIVTGSSFKIAPSGASIRPSPSATNATTPIIKSTGYIIGPSGATGASGYSSALPPPTQTPSSGLSISYSLPGTSASNGLSPSGTGLLPGYGNSTSSYLPASSGSPSSGFLSKPSTTAPVVSNSASTLSSIFPYGGTGTPILPSTTLSSSAPISSAGTGTGGCKMVKRFGKRMLVC